METLTMVTLFILSLSLLIILHELGHFLPAKWFKTRVEKFFLFFDVKFSLFSKKIGETEYGIGWLPLGGYVKIAGMVDESMDTDQLERPPEPWEYRSKPAWQRLIIILGGVIVNFLLGFFIFAMLLFTFGEQYLSPENAIHGIYVDSLGYEMGLRDGDQILNVAGRPLKSLDNGSLIKEIVIHNANYIEVNRNGSTKRIAIDPKWVSVLSKNTTEKISLFGPRYPMKVAQVIAGQPAASADIRKDDVIIEVNGRSTPYQSDFFRSIKGKKAQKIDLTLLRNEEDTVRTSLVTTDQAKLGIGVYGPDALLQMSKKEYSFFGSIPAGVAKGVNTLATQVKAFGQMFTGKIKARDSLGGPITIARIFPKTWDWPQFWNLTALLSLILGFMNLLPIPALDGGHALFILVEMITGRKPSEKLMQYATMAGMIILLLLMVFIIGLDISRLF